MNLAFQTAEASSLRLPHRSGRAVPAIPRRFAANQDILQRKAGCACGGGCPRCSGESLLIQNKLAVSQPGDAHEREADRVADAVMMGHGLAHVVQQRAAASNTALYRSIDTTTAPDATPESIVIDTGPDCDPTKNEGYPNVKRGAHRHAVGLAQTDLNVLLPQVKACLTNPDCMKGYSGKAQNFMKEQIDALSAIPIAVDCKYGLDTLHAVYAVQAYMFKDETFWTGKIGPQTWYAIDAGYRGSFSTPPYTPDQF